MRKINIGGQSFEKIRSRNCFYVDKTSFIKEWWENRDKVTAITRPRRFGKTLNMDMLKCFFSNEYAGRSDLFEGLDIWKEEKYRELQGTYPVIFLSFARIKRTTMEAAVKAICEVLSQVCRQYSYLLKSDVLLPSEKKKLEGYFSEISVDEAPDVLNILSEMLNKEYGKKVLIFLDEYDTPLQEAFVHGYWDEMAEFIRGLFSSTFKTNPSLERAIMTGITRVSKESIFSDLNNLQVVTTTSRRYETCFGFTQEEVDQALKEYHLSDQREMVKKWYDGFTFGSTRNIYNPWSILMFLDNRGEYAPYWANTSSNALISYELRTADNSIKSEMEDLLNGGTVETEVDEQVIFSQLDTNQEAIWSLFLASGYLKILDRHFIDGEYTYILTITNLEVKQMFRKLISEWFGNARDEYSGFIKALVSGNAEGVQECLINVLMNTASFYDTKKYISENRKPESFYHGLVLGMISQEKKYHITSNRESGDGRYDIMMRPLDKKLPGIIIEFKILNPAHEKTLEETAERALAQIKEKKYDTELINAGVAAEEILHYGMGFSGKNVAVKKG